LESGNTGLGTWGAATLPCIAEPPEPISSVIYGLAEAWNAGNSIGFASYFAEDGDLVNIHGMRLRGRAAIGGLYDLLFRSVFRRSIVTGEVAGSRTLCEDVVLLHLRVGIHIPAGSLAGNHDAVSSLVLKRRGPNWMVASLHNTLVTDGVDRKRMASAA
jgi:uncharacterized protein (TIGR02246 family)